MRDEIDTKRGRERKDREAIRQTTERLRQGKHKAEPEELDEYKAEDLARGMNWEKAKSVNYGDGFPTMSSPLEMITHRKKVQFSVPDTNNTFITRTFIVVIHGAYNAMGLIGSECNGIGILDHDKSAVLLSEHMRQGTGYFGPNQAQIDEWKRVCLLSYPEFQAFVNQNKRARYSI